MMAYIESYLKKKKKEQNMSIHDRLPLELNECLEKINIPEWMIQEKTTLIQKKPFSATIDR